MAGVGPTAARLIPQVGRKVSDRTQKLVASFVGPGSGVRLETVDRTHSPEAACSALERFFGEYTSGTVREQLVETHGLHFAVDGFNDVEVHCCAHSIATEAAPILLPLRSAGDRSSPVEAPADASDAEAAAAACSAVRALPPLVAVAVAHALDYLRSFKSEAALRHCASFRPLTDARSMRLSPNTLEQLEVRPRLLDRVCGCCNPRKRLIRRILLRSSL